MTENLYPCVSCGFLVNSEPPGSYSICQICDWEDDHVQLKFPELSGGANRVSLFESQQSILAEIPFEIREHDGLTRDPDWRPLTNADLKGRRAQSPEDGKSYFEAATEDAPPYYWKK